MNKILASLFLIAAMNAGATSFWHDIKEDPIVDRGNIWDDRCDCKEK